MNDLDKLKQEYNHNLTRYYNGCRFCNEHQEVDKYTPELIRILNKMNELLEDIRKYQYVNEEEILRGFKE